MKKLKLSKRDIFSATTDIYHSQPENEKDYPKQQKVPLDTEAPKRKFFRLDPKRIIKDKEWDLSMGLNALNEQNMPKTIPTTT